LDVKVGRGAFMATLEDGRALAQTMVDIGRDAGRQVIAVLSDMNQPLGEAVGNALEVGEALATLNGGGPADLREHCLMLAGFMLKLAGRGAKWADPDEVRKELARHLDDGSALAKFRQMVGAQGGDVTMVDDPSKLPQASIKESFDAPQSGFIAQVAADQIAWGAFELGAGREKKSDALDLAVGLAVHVKVGDRVEQGKSLVTIYANDAGKIAACRARLQTAFTFSDQPVEPLPLFYDVLSQ
ncbi:MAG: pyrimidine-nucleoside phosphorylase, partial [Chloroflexota bacterium]